MQIQILIVLQEKDGPRLYESISWVQYMTLGKGIIWYILPEVIVVELKFYASKCIIGTITTCFKLTISESSH